MIMVIYVPQKNYKSGKKLVKGTVSREKLLN